MSDLADLSQSSRSRLSPSVARLGAGSGWIRREACQTDRRGALRVRHLGEEWRTWIWCLRVTIIVVAVAVVIRSEARAQAGARAVELAALAPKESV